MAELIKNAITGVNIIPTVLLGIVLVYWIIVIIGAIDIDFLDFDLDLDGDIDGGPFYALLAFLNLDKFPVMFIISIACLNFWIIAMLVYYLPISRGGLLNGILLIPILIVSLLITRIITNPLKGIFNNLNVKDDRANEITSQLCKLNCDVKNGRLGQANIERDGASLLINVKSEYEEDEFVKDEEAYVKRKDSEKNIYYIIKIRE
ncbi:MAG: hypothetical protein ACRDA5_07490 [Clostridium sp.]